MNPLLSLKDILDPVEYDNYIMQMTYDEKFSRNDRLVFKVPNIYLESWIKVKYAEKIANIYEKETGIKAEIIIEARKKNPKQNTQNDENIIQKKIYTSSSLNPDYTFSSFIVGQSNDSAVRVAKTVAQKQNTFYNPLVIYGNTGLGKTHLLNAIGNANVNEGKKVIYTTSEQFLNDFMMHINKSNMDRFKEKYRTCDYFLIDDIQFLNGKDTLQEEFFHTFNVLKENNSQIVVTSDRPPKDMNWLEERLKTRFLSGFIVDIKPPDLNTKIDIIKTKCQLDGIVLNDEIINYIATHMNDSVREIEGVLIKLSFSKSIIGCEEITIDLVKNVLKEYITESKENISLEMILETVARYYNIKPSDIKSKTKRTNIVTARKVVIYLSRNLTPNSMPMLAKFFGMKDHSTISKTIKSIKEMMEKDSVFKMSVEELKNKIK